MSPAQFLSRLQKGNVPAVCLFLGAEAYERRRCREALIQAHLGGEESDDRVTRIDAGETTLAEILDDARALSLFATERVIVVTTAEAAVPRTSRAAAEDESDESEWMSRDRKGAVSSDDSSPSGGLTAYLADPTPGVVLVFEATRFTLDGEDKKKADRVRKFYRQLQTVVEFERLAPEEVRAEMQRMAKRLNLQFEPAALSLLADSLGSDMLRVATELEKLSLYASPEQTIGTEDVLLLIPDTRTSTIYALVNALGKSDRKRALSSLDALCRENEYLPLALAFISSQFRQALAAKKAGLRSAQQVQSYFTKTGVPMWSSRAEQVASTAQSFSAEKLVAGLKLVFETDRDLRSARPDDRTVMEECIVRLTG